MGTGSLLNRADLTPYFEVDFLSVPSLVRFSRRVQGNRRLTMPFSAFEVIFPAWEFPMNSQYYLRSGFLPQTMSVHSSLTEASSIVSIYLSNSTSEA